MDFYIVADKLK